MSSCRSADVLHTACLVPLQGEDYFETCHPVKYEDVKYDNDPYGLGEPKGEIL